MAVKPITVIGSNLHNPYIAYIDCMHWTHDLDRGYM